MARFNGQIKSFTSGELSPRVRRRVDIENFYNGNEVQENFITQPQGPAYHRAGTVRLCTTPSTAAVVPGGSIARLIPFSFDDDDHYIMEFTHNKLRLLRNNTLVTAVNGTDIVALERDTNKYIIHINYDPVNLSSTTYNTSYTVTVNGITESGYEHLNGISWIISNVTTSTYNASYSQIEIAYAGAVASSAVAVTSGTTNSDVTFTTTYSAADLYNLQTAQSYDTVYIVIGDETPKTLVRTGATSFTFGNMSFSGSKSFNTAGNYPHCVAVFENRLFFANTATHPTGIWASEPGVLNNFSETDTTDAADPYFFLLSSSQEIVWLFGGNDGLFAQTLADCHLCYPPDGTALTAAVNFAKRTIHNVGSRRNWQPTRKDENFFFIDKTGKKLMRVDYSRDRETYYPDDLMKAAEHMSGDGIYQTAYQRGKEDIVWVTREDGRILGFTYDLAANCFAWHRHTIGCDLESGYKSYVGGICTLPSIPEFDASYDPLYLCVSRYSEDGTSFSTIEMLTPPPIYSREEDFYNGSSYESDQADFFDDNFERQILGCYMDGFVEGNGSLGVPSGTLGATTGTGVTFTAGSNIFTANDVGKRIYGRRAVFLDPITGLSMRNRGEALIVGYTSATVVTVDIVEDFEDTSFSADSTLSYNGRRLGGGWYLGYSEYQSVYLPGDMDGKIISVYCDGVRFDNQTVTNSQVLVPINCRVIHVGYERKAIIKTVNLSGGGTIGPSETKVKGASKAGVCFLDTMDCLVGSNPYRLERVYFRENNALTEFQTPLFSGDKEVVFEDDWSREKHVYVIADQAYPCTVLMIVPYMTTSND